METKKGVALSKGAIGALAIGSAAIGALAVQFVLQGLRDFGFGG